MSQQPTPTPSTPGAGQDHHTDRDLPDFGGDFLHEGNNNNNNPSPLATPDRSPVIPRANIPQIEEQDTSDKVRRSHYP
jgi:hypothetical protein